MRWIAPSLFNAVAGIGRTLLSTGGLQTQRPLPFAFAFAAVASLLTGGYMLALGVPIRLHSWGLVSGALVAGAAACVIESLARAPNPAYTMGVFRVQAVLSAVAAHFLLGSELGPVQTGGMVLALIGAWLIATQPVETTHRSESPEALKSSRSWVPFAIGAALFATAKDIINKRGLQMIGKGGVPTMLLSNTVAHTVVLALITLAVEGTLLPVPARGASKVSEPVFWVLSTGLADAVSRASVMLATDLSPNVGYVKSVDTLGVALTALAAHAIYGDPVGDRAMKGIGLVTAGVAAVCLG